MTGTGMAVKIQYDSGYQKYASALEAYLTDEYAGKVDVTLVSDLAGNGAFEVTCGEKLIHSKLTIDGHGTCTTEEELDNIVNAITNIINAITT